MAKSAHFNFISFFKKNWFLILLASVIVFNVIYAVYIISFSAEILIIQVPYYLRYIQENPGAPWVDILTSNIVSAKFYNTLYITLAIIFIILSLTLLVISILSNKNQKLKKYIVIITTIIILVSTPWLIYDISMHIASLDDSILTRLNYIYKIIFDAITIALNITLTIVIYFRHFYHKKKKSV